MASRDLLVRIVGDSKDVEAAFARSSKAANRFGTNVTTTGKQADVAAKRVSSFAKGAAAGFGGAVAFNAGLNAIRSVIGAATESQQVLGQTRVALESTGKSWNQYGQEIEDAIAKQSRLGFDDEALLRTFSLFVRQANDVGEALRRNSIAMNLARARFIDLEQAATLVNKAALGQAGALRRVGIDARNGASGVELLAQLERQFAGAAEDASNSATGAQDRFKVSVENAQEAIGTLLLPAITEMANNFAKAADQITALIGLLNRLGKIKIPTIEIPFSTKDVGGGTVGGLASKIGGVVALGAISPAGLLGIAIKELVDRIRGEPPPNTKLAADAFDAKFDTFIESLETDINGSVDRANKNIAAFGQKGFKPLEVNELGATLQRQFDAALAALDLTFDKAVFAGNDAQALAALDEVEATIRRRIASQGQTTELMRQLFEVEQKRAGIIRENKEAARQTVKEAKALAAENARAAREQAKALEQQRQFRAIGLSPEGSKPTPTIANLQKQLGALLGRGDLTKVTRNKLKNIGKVLSDPIRKATTETREAIRDLFDTIRSEFDKGSKEQSGPLTKTTGLNARKILEGLGLTPEAERELRQRLSSFNSAGIGRANANNRPTGSFVGGPQPITVNTTVTLDGKVVGNSVTRSQQKDKRRNPVQKRGPRSGI